MNDILSIKDPNTGEWIPIPALKGNDGFSPIVKVTEVEGGYEVKITDKNGIKTFLVNHGEKGDNYVLTEADKQEIAQMAVALFPIYNGEVESV